MKTPKVAITVLQKVINQYETDTKSRFHPTKDFYNSTEINRIRFWQLVKGKKELLVSEAITLSDYFKVPLNELCKSEKPGHYSK